MKIFKTALKDVLIIEPDIYSDDRGVFLETWNKNVFSSAINRNVEFVQDNQSNSKKGVLRGLHYQLKKPQGKLVRVCNGHVKDVVVDLRLSSPTFGQHIIVELSGEKLQELWIPEGFAHGFFVLSDFAIFLYKTTEYYDKLDEKCIRWDDPFLNIDWLDFSDKAPIISKRDQEGFSFEEAEKFQ